MFYTTIILNCVGQLISRFSHFICTVPASSYKLLQPLKGRMRPVIIGGGGGGGAELVM